MSAARSLALFVLVVALAGCSKSTEPNIATVAPDAFEKPRAEPVGDREAHPAPAGDEAPPDTGILALPADGGVWPWPVKAVGRVPTATVPLSSALKSASDIRSAALNLAAGRAIIMAWETDFKNKTSGTRIFLCDLERGRVTYQWQVPGRYLGVFNLHADGRRFLARRADYSQRERHLLELWTITDDMRLLHQEWQPFTAGHDPAGEQREPIQANFLSHDGQVRWAGFVGRDHIVTVCSGGELKVWECAGLKQVAILPGVVGLPALTPDGERLAVVVGDRVALFDPAALQVIAARRIGKPPENLVLAFHDDGTRLVCGGTNRAVTLDLVRGGIHDVLLPELRLEAQDLIPDFGWAGDCFYYRGDLYDMETPIKIWHYGAPPWATARGGHVWAVVQELGKKDVALRAFALPHPTAAAGIRAAAQRTDLFALRPGDLVRVDVAGVPSQRQQEVRDALERRVKQLGYRVHANAPTVFVANVDRTGPRVSKSYTVGNRTVTGTFTQRHARLKIVKDGQVLWETAASETPGFIIVIPARMSAEDYISGFGSPDYDVYFKRPLPGLLRATKDARPLGESGLTAGGIKDR